VTTDERVIAFGDDRSAYADRAWLWINNQRWPGWSVEVISAVRVPRDVVSDELPVRLAEWTPSSPRTVFAETGVTSVRHVRSTADPRLILGTCDHASLLVIGLRGAHGLQTFLLGGTGDHLLHHSPAPLVVAKTPDAAKRILVCTDGSPGAQHAVESFARLPMAADAEQIAVLGVAPTGMYDVREQMSDAVDAATEALSPLRSEPCRVESETDVADCIVRHVDALRAQLVVLGANDLSGLRRVVLGSTASGVAHRAACSVLVVPEPDDGSASG
jgi:nucleotide-binding universal stress UspA family protein